MVWKLNIYVIYFIRVTFCCLVLSPINTASVKSIIQLLKSRGSQNFSLPGTTRGNVFFSCVIK